MAMKPFPGHRKMKKDGLKYFSRQAIRCEIMGTVDGRKSTINPVHGSRLSRSSIHYATYVPETKIQAVFTPIPETSPDSYRASFHVISSLVTYMTLFPLRYFILEQMTQFMLLLRSSINNFWFTLYASDLVSAIVSSYNIIGYKVMFVTKTLFIFFCAHPSAFKGSNNLRGNEQGLLPHIPEAAKTRKQRKMTLEKLERSCRLILEDILYTIDAQKIEAACIVLVIAVSWRVLYGLFLYMLHRFYSMKDRE